MNANTYNVFPNIRKLNLDSSDQPKTLFCNAKQTFDSLKKTDCRTVVPMKKKFFALACEKKSFCALSTSKVKADVNFSAQYSNTLHKFRFSMLENILNRLVLKLGFTRHNVKVCGIFHRQT